MQHMRSGTPRVLLFLTALVLFMSTSASAEVDVQNYNIPEGKAIKTLKAVAQQSHSDILYHAKDTRGVKTQAIIGSYTPKAALEQMLQGTPLTVIEDKLSGAFAVVRHESEIKSDSPLGNPMQTRNTMKVRNKQRSAFVAGLMAGLFFVNGLAAQDDDSSDEVVELSPFTVDSSDSEGYRATHTLAGTRLRTELKDVGASISVYTKEFLEDTGATNLNELLIYTNGTEVGGLGGNLSNTSDLRFQIDFVDENIAANQSTRVRGLSAADNTRNFFASAVPLDSYNVDSVTINRGSNNILFGLGSPAGIIDRSLAQAKAVNANEVTLRLDEHGSVRAVVDINRTAMEGKFNTRVIGLYDYRQFQQDPSLDRDRRLYAAFDYRPAENTQITANAEFGERWASLPYLAPLNDAFTGWWELGKPLAPAYWSRGDHNSWPQQQEDPLFRRIFDIPDIECCTPLFYMNGGLGQVNTYMGITGGLGQPAAVILPGDPLYDRLPEWLRGPDNDFAPLVSSLQPSGRFEQQRANSLGDSEYTSLSAISRGAQIQDTSIWDYNNRNFFGRNDKLANDFSTFNIALNQDFLERKLGFQISYDRQDFDSFGERVAPNHWRGRNLSIDVTQFLPDGRANPNIGRPWMTLGQRWEEGSVEQDVLRFTGYGKLDLSERDGILGQLLGDHTLTLLYDESETTTWNLSGPSVSADSDFTDANGMLQTFAKIWWVGLPSSEIWYVGPSVMDQLSPANTEITGLPRYVDKIKSYTASFIDPDTLTYTTQSFQALTYPEDREALIGRARQEKVETESFAAALHSKFLDDSLAVTLGWREDTFQLFDAGEPSESHRRGTRDISPEGFPLPTTPDVDVTESTFSKSFVYHVPSDALEGLPGSPELSLHYSDSENFSPRTTARSPLGGFYGPPSGETEDYGITIGLLNNRVVAKMTWYETNEVNVEDPAFQTPYQWMFATIPALGYQDLTREDPRLQTLEQAVPAELQAAYEWEWTTLADGRTVLEVGMNQGTDISSNDSEGFEFELTANITPNWRLMFNAARQEAVRGMRGQNFSDIFFEVGNTYLTNSFVADELELGTQGTGLRSTITSRFNDVRAAQAQSGVNVSELREWRWNIITNYTFDEDSSMRGFSVGGAVRYQDAVGIGHTYFSDPDLGILPDVDNPVFGPDETKVDLWVGYKKRIMNDKVDWSLQLNVTNAFDVDDLIPVFHNPNRLPDVVRLGKGREFFLTSKFKF